MMPMNIAAGNSAPTDTTFVEYFKWLGANGFVPPNGHRWLDYVRSRGNEATHEIALMRPEDATAPITYVESLLRFICEIRI